MEVLVEEAAVEDVVLNAVGAVGAVDVAAEIEDVGAEVVEEAEEDLALEASNSSQELEPPLTEAFSRYTIYTLSYVFCL